MATNPRVVTINTPYYKVSFNQDNAIQWSKFPDFLRAIYYSDCEYLFMWDFVGVYSSVFPEFYPFCYELCIPGHDKSQDGKLVIIHHLRLDRASILDFKRQLDDTIQERLSKLNNNDK